jgi:TolB-like protein/Tfp pilus assembly protein PilF
MAEDDGMDTASGGGISRTVFLSYASRDAEIANTVCRELESRGIRCWIAPRDVAPGALYADAIVRAINEAKVLLLVLSQSAIDSAHVGKEIERASSKRKRLIALRIDAAQLSPALEYFLSESQWVDFVPDGSEIAAAKISEAIQGHLNPASVADRKPNGTTPRPAAHAERSVVSPRSRRFALPMLAAGGVMALLLGYVMVQRLWHRSPSESPQAATPAAVDQQSVAVLPFLDLSEKKDQEYFADGLSEELIDLLAKTPGLHVPARTSSFYFKGKSEDIPYIAKRLLVAHVLEGSVRKAGDRLRVTAQLVRADNGYHLWSETYDRRFDDIFKIQDEVAGAVVAALKVSLFQGEKPRPAPTASTEAYALYVQARAISLHNNAADQVKAVDYLQQAIRLDPRFADAWAALADERIIEYQFGVLPFAQAREESVKAAEQALSLKPSLGSAHRSMANVHFIFEWDWVSAETEIQRARELDPTDADTLNVAGVISQALGRFDEAIELNQKAISRDPLNAFNYNWLGSAQLAVGRYTDSEIALRRAIELAPPNGFGARYTLIELLLASGQLSAALKTSDEFQRPIGHAWGKALASFALGRKTDSDSALAELKTQYAANNAALIADVHGYRGELDEAFEWLERAYQEHESSLTQIKSDLSLKILHEDPRYHAFLRRMNLPD